MDYLKNETNEFLISLLVRLEIEKHDNYRHDDFYQKQIDAVLAEIIKRMEG